MPARQHPAARATFGILGRVLMLLVMLVLRVLIVMLRLALMRVRVLLMRMVLVGVLLVRMTRMMLRRMAVAGRMVAGMTRLGVVVVCHALREAPRPPQHALCAARRHRARHSQWQGSVEPLAPTRRKWQRRV